MSTTHVLPELRPIMAALDSAHRTMRQATDGLRPDGYYYRPTPESNSIAWLIWHLSRWKDLYSALLTGERHAWAVDGWAGRFDLPTEAEGYGDTPATVAAFRPEPSLLWGYADAAHAATVRRFRSLTAASLAHDYETPYGTVAGADLPEHMLMDFAPHVGQIAYIRGMLTGRGWTD